MVHPLRSITVPFKIYYAARYLGAQKRAIRRARKNGDFEAEGRAIRKANLDWSTCILRLFHLNVVIDGQENIPDKGPIVMVSNHQGYADIPVLVYAINKFPMSYVAKRMMRNLPYYGRWLTKYQRCVMIDRNDLRASAQSIQQGLDMLSQGYSMAIFPEGTRSQSDTPGIFKHGSFRLATESGCPILPVSVSGSFRVWETQGYPIPRTIHVTIHPLVPTAGLEHSEYPALIRNVTDTICSAL